jgi:hypothetical protein
MAIPWQPIDLAHHKQVLLVRKQVQQVHKQVLELERFATKIPHEDQGLARAEAHEAAYHKRVGLQPKAGWKPSPPHPDSPPRKVQRSLSDASTEMVPSPVARRWYEKEMKLNQF